MSFFGLFKKQESVPIHGWYTRPRNTRVCDPSRSFLDTKETWNVFDYQAQVPLVVPGSYGLQEDAFTDRKFVMYKNTTNGNTLAFGQQILPNSPLPPAKIRGRMHLLTPDQVRDLDEHLLNGVQSIRTRVRLLFPNYITEYPKECFKKSKRLNQTIPVNFTVAHAWMYFDRTQPWAEKFQDDYDLYGEGERSTFKPIPVVRHYREHIRNFFLLGHLPKREGYTKVNEIRTASPTLSQVS